MKFALVLLLVLPCVFTATINKRLLDSVLGFDVCPVVESVMAVMTTDETEAQCEDSACPPVLESFGVTNNLLVSLGCVAVCKEAQILANLVHTDDDSDCLKK